MKKVLFVCIENSCRSQMAEAYAKMKGGKTLKAYSSGSRPSGVVNPKAIKAMREVGYDMSGHRSEPTDNLPEKEFDYVITMGCGDECPYIPAQNREDWDLPDPGNMDETGFRSVRDEIGERVQNLIKKIDEGK